MDCTRRRQCIVGLATHKTRAFVERDCTVHRGHGIEVHGPITDRPCLRDKPIDEAKTDASLTESVAHVEAFHLAILARQATQGDTTRDGTIRESESETTARRRILAWQ